MANKPKGFGKLDGRIKAFTVPYAQAEARLTSLIARVVTAGTLGKPAVRRAVKAEVRTMLLELNKQGIPNAKMIVDQAYELGRMIANIQSKGGRVDATALSLLQDNLAGRLQDSTVHVGRRVDDVFRKEGLRIASHVVGGEDVPNASARLERQLERQGITAFTDRLGREWGLATYAEMVVRTTASEAVFYGTQATLLEADIDLVIVNKVPRPCERCKRYDGKVFSLTGRAIGYPLLDVIFPIHPNCMHFISPAPAAFEERQIAA